MAKEKVPAIVARTSEIVASMTPALQKVYLKISKGLADTNKTDIHTRYSWGLMINKIRNTPRADTYGDGATQQLADALEINVRVLYQMADFAAAFTPEAVDEAIENSTANGRAMTWSNFRTLSGIDNPKLREQCLKRCIAEAMTSRELDEMVAAKLDHSRDVDEPIPARKVQTVLKQLTKQATSIVAKQKDYESRLFNALDKAGPEAVNDTLVDDIDVARSRLTELESFIKASLRRLNTAEERALGMLRDKDRLATKKGKVIAQEPDEDEEDLEEEEEIVDTDYEEDEEESDEDEEIGRAHV